MARRRSRKNVDAPRRAAAGNPQKITPSTSSGEDLASAGAASATVMDRDKNRSARPSSMPRVSGRAVRLSACIAGMILTLLLGLYLGTLLPGAFHERHGTESVATRPQIPVDVIAGTTQVGAGTGEASVHGLPPELAARLAALEAAVRKEPASAENWTELGNLFFDAGRVREAINAYERSLALAPGNADVLTDLGIMYREDKAPQKAVDCFRQALAANPRHANALFNSGVVLYTDLGRKDEAVAAWRRLLEVNPHARAPDGRAVSEMVRRLEEPLRRQ